MRHRNGPSHPQTRHLLHRLAARLNRQAHRVLHRPAASSHLRRSPVRLRPAWKDLEAQVALGPRPAGSAAIQKTREYILAELKKAGVDARQQIQQKTPLGETSMANVIGTIPGRRAERLAIASHFDTNCFGDIRFVGASDGGSSTRGAPGTRPRAEGPSERIHNRAALFDGEEAVVEWGRNNDNTYGSRYYVDDARRAGTLSGLARSCCST